MLELCMVPVAAKVLLDSAASQRAACGTTPDLGRGQTDEIVPRGNARASEASTRRGRGEKPKSCVGTRTKSRIRRALRERG